ncbi:radical SAM protein [Enterococcus dongliensis]|uniref:radical SAM protein n=1 Tax=Enterococcus dongliensis TaxID=2559925 RepID=UPI00288F7B1D|nr:radical SAM protein [Enterococcus dongliensis]MDT2643533.1 radical SAM protein [Enterococcus dongliensis]
MLGNDEIKTIIYPDEKYGVIFNQKNGFFLRKEFSNTSEPFMSVHGPELIDISITNWCDKGCSFCYKESNCYGNHMSIETFDMILNQAQKMDCLQIALGGGNPNQNPDFCEMIKLSRIKYGIVPSYTTNGRGLTTEVLEATKDYCGAVAVSYYSFSEVKNSIEKFNGFGIKPNIHFLLDSNSIRKAIEILQNPPAFIEGVNAIVFLNYKPVGRGIKKKLLCKQSPHVSTFFSEVSKFQKKYKTGIGFDSCSVSGIKKYLNVSDIFVEPCESARFSMYIDENAKAYPCSFMIDKISGIEVTNDNLEQIWIDSRTFVNMRKLLQKEKGDGCINGCPIFPEIDF